MTRALARLFPEILRLSLAAVVILSGLASARMQGQVAAFPSTDLRATVLCSGTVMPGDPLNPASGHDHAFCLLCHGATGDLPRSCITTPLTMTVARAPERALDTTPRAITAHANLARGPPLSDHSI